jgi:hypothetical protein
MPRLLTDILRACVWHRPKIWTTWNVLQDREMVTVNCEKVDDG